MVFNGQKIGFTHLTIRPAPGNRYEIRSEAAIVLHFLGLEKKINLKSHDVVNDNLTLEHFSYDYNIDQSQLKLSGKVEGNQLRVTIISGGKPAEQVFPLPEKLYPASAIALYPSLRGLALGIPTRVVNGLVYSEELKGFLYHSWAESHVGGAWLPIDPTFGQLAVDATHIKLLEGEKLSDLLPLIDWVGKIRVRVLAVEHRNP